ncbi:DUF2577 domain-containing protein [Clostridium lundense]|uniref:DUF2577 domain-containing protein n=1 Tax=Clostridium lundense TaxID=319475 RepID=UPI0004894CFC|nr:DUF2577 domain-containing protein [Clostridium lundense]
MQDPFVELVNIMKEKGAAYNPPSIEIGKVISSNPLIVEVGNLQLTKNNFIVADYLVNEYKRKITIPRSRAEGTAGEHSVSEVGIKEGEIIYKDGLKKDDKIAMLSTQDRQIYIILARVVTL